MAAGGTPTNIALGPGRLWVAPIGTAEPTNASSALTGPWRAIGYTEEGSTLTIEITTEEIEVAEELDPVAYRNTKRTSTMELSMAEATRQNLALAIGAVPNASNTAEWYEPPAAGTDSTFMMIWDSEETAAGNASNVRWVFRVCSVSGTIEIARQKAPAKSLLPVTINIQKPASGAAPWRVYPNSAGRV